MSSTDFTVTGVTIDPSPSPIGSRHGIEFNGEHLIMLDNFVNLHWLSKIILDFPAGGGGGIPGFADYVLLLSVLTLAGVFFLLKQGKQYWQKI